MDVDLAAVLEKGQKFRVYNVLDIKQTIGGSQPAVSATYDGKPVPFPVRKGNDCPDFDSFLILPEQAP